MSRVRDITMLEVQPEAVIMKCKVDYPIERYNGCCDGKRPTPQLSSHRAERSPQRL